MLRVKGWKKFQHYKDRNPPWIKLNKELLHNRKWFKLSDASKALSIMLWLIASEHEKHMSGLLDDDPEEIAFRTRMDEKKVVECIKELISQGFIEHVKKDDADLLAPCYQDATPETETETDYNNKGGVKKIAFDDLSVSHISDWLTQKRVSGKYLDIDEYEQLEHFKNYCVANGRVTGKKAYSDFVRALQNSFGWESAKKKGTLNGSHKQKPTNNDVLARKLAQQDAIAAAESGEQQADTSHGEPMLCHTEHLREDGGAA